MSIGDASIGPQGYGRSSDAVVCVYLRQTGRLADFLHHVCESVYASVLCSNHTSSSGLKFAFGYRKNELQFGLTFSR